MQKLIELFKKYVTKELILYGITGVMTTVVNWGVTYLLYDIAGVEENVTTVLAWIAAVAFAYIVNNLVVFKMGFEGFKRELEKIAKFTAARLVTFVFEWLPIFLFVTLGGLNMWLVKIPTSIIVILLNYIFSKLCIFVKKKKDE